MPLVRTVARQDVPGVLQLIAGIYAEYDCVLDAEKEDPPLLNPHQYFRANGGDFWVVEDQGAIRATVAILLHPEGAEIRNLYVHPTLRRQGWGRRLVKLAIAYARTANHSRIFLWSDTRFLAAHQLYQSLGFQQKGQRDLQDSNHSIEYGFEMALPVGMVGEVKR